MAQCFEPAQEQIDGYAEWVAERPSHVRTVAEKFTPWTLYKMKSTGHRCTVSQFDEMEDGGVTLNRRHHR